jgi:hypothetical protein
MKKVVLCGFADFHLKGVESEKDFRADGWELWTLNDWWRRLAWLKTPDRVFQVHCDENREFHPENYGNAWPSDWKKRFNESGAEIVCSVPLPGIEKCRLYPARLIREYGPTYFRSSLNYMLAMAIDEKFEHIKVADFAMLQGSEYEYQLPGAVYAVMDARERGITVEASFEDVWLHLGFMNGKPPLKQCDIPYGVFSEEVFADAPAVQPERQNKMKRKKR